MHSWAAIPFFVFFAGDAERVNSVVLASVGDSPTADQPAVDRPATFPEEVSGSENPMLACRMLPRWWKKNLIDLKKAPKQVQDLIASHGLETEYAAMMEAVYKTPRSHVFNWKMSKIYEATWGNGEGFEAQFASKGVDIFLRAVDRPIGGTGKSICFGESERKLEPVKFQYTDAKDSQGNELPYGVVAAPMVAVRSRGGPGAIQPSAAEPLTDLKRFMFKRNLTNLFQQWQVQSQSDSSKAASAAPEPLAVSLEQTTLNFKQRFAEENIAISTCYHRANAWNWRQPFTGYQLQLWVVFRDNALNQDYKCDEPILPRKTCESVQAMPRMLQKTHNAPLELRALQEVHGITSQYTSMIQDIVATGEGSTFLERKVYQQMYKYEKSLLQNNVAMTLVHSSPGTSELCYHDLTQGVKETSENDYHDAKTVRHHTGTGPEGFKTLSHAVFGEALVHVEGRLELHGEVPVDVQRMLEEKQAMELHQQVAAKLAQLPSNPKGVPVQIKDVFKVVDEEFWQAFSDKGVNIFVCYKVQDVRQENIPVPVHILFPWIEYVDVSSQHRVYRPEEAIRKTDLVI